MNVNTYYPTMQNIEKKILEINYYEMLIITVSRCDIIYFFCSISNIQNQFQKYIFSNQKKVLKANKQKNSIHKRRKLTNSTWRSRQINASNLSSFEHAK